MIVAAHNPSMKNVSSISTAVPNGNLAVSMYDVVTMKFVKTDKDASVCPTGFTAGCFQQIGVDGKAVLHALL